MFLEGNIRIKKRESGPRLSFSLRKTRKLSADTDQRTTWHELKYRPLDSDLKLYDDLKSVMHILVLLPNYWVKAFSLFLKLKMTFYIIYFKKRERERERTRNTEYCFYTDFIWEHFISMLFFRHSINYI